MKDGGVQPDTVSHFAVAKRLISLENLVKDVEKR
jgi:hypothetical protein